MNGQEFERVALFYLTKISGCTVATRQDDIYKGTDLYYYGVPIDITLSDDKDNLLEGSYKRLRGLNAWTAVRVGNKHISFDTPVVVLGFTVGKAEIAIAQIQSNAKLMLDAISDQYWNVMDTIEEAM